MEHTRCRKPLCGQPKRGHYTKRPKSYASDCTTGRRLAFCLPTTCPEQPPTAWMSALPCSQQSRTSCPMGDDDSRGRYGLQGSRVALRRQLLRREGELRQIPSKCSVKALRLLGETSSKSKLLAAEHGV
jgi:hypothetical protein